MSKRSRHHRGNDAEFGSDSFLDIVANIVGILIILIVLVGVRVKTAPMPVAQVPPKPEVVPDNPIAEPSDTDRERLEQYEIDKRNRQNEIDRLQARYELELAERLRQVQDIERENQTRKRAHDRQLASIEIENNRRNHLVNENNKVLSRAQERTKQREEQIQLRKVEQEQIDKETQLLQAAISESQLKVDEQQQVLAQRQQAKTLLDQKLQRANDSLVSLRKLAADETAKVDLQNVQWNELLNRMLELQKDLEVEPGRQKQSAQWVHHPTPIGQFERKDVLLLSCSKNRVAYTFSDNLVQLAMKDARVRFSTLRSSGSTITGNVGPVGGFQMTYEAKLVRTMGIEGQPISIPVLEGYRLFPVDPEVGEPASQALEQVSKLNLTLLKYPAQKYGIVVFVTPDSFANAKPLSSYLNERGYSVAFFPNPQGEPIGVSAKGFRALSQ